MPLDQLAAALERAGWRETYLAAPADLHTPLAGDPVTAAGDLPRVYFVSRR